MWLFLLRLALSPLSDPDALSNVTNIYSTGADSWTDGQLAI